MRVGHHALVLRHQRVVEAAADQALDGIEGVGRVGHGLALGALADQPLAAVAEGDHAGGGAGALRVLDHADIAGAASMIATQELVVPRSIPMTLLMQCLLFSGGARPEAPRAALW